MIYSEPYWSCWLHVTSLKGFNDEADNDITEFKAW